MPKYGGLFENVSDLIKQNDQGRGSSQQQSSEPRCFPLTNSLR